MSAEVKTCRRCGIEKPLTEFHKGTSARSNNTSSYCKLCDAVRGKAWREANAEKCASYRKNQNRSLAKQRDLRYREKAPEAYMRLLLSRQGLSDKDITPELIEMKRTSLTLRRLSRSMKRAAKQQTEKS